MIDMGAFSDEFVVVRKGQHQGDSSEITINCPDKVGLGCDLARIVFEFGLTVVKGDMSSDGRWCFVTLRVVPRASLLKVRWSLLKERLEDICPSAVPLLLPQQDRTVQSTRMFLLQVCSKDRTGLLNDVAQKLWELEFTIHKVKISTSPDGKAVNLFFVTDNRYTKIAAIVGDILHPLCKVTQNFMSVLIYRWFCIGIKPNTQKMIPK